MAYRPKESNKGIQDYNTFAMRKVTFGTRSRVDLDRIADSLTGRILNGQGGVDIGRTNRHNLELAQRMRVPPLAVIDNTLYFRVVRYEKGGLLSIFYTDSMPDAMRQIMHGEVVLLAVAAKYLGVDLPALKELIVRGELKFHRPNHVYFAELMGYAAKSLSPNPRP